MMDPQERLSYLLDVYKNKKATDQELFELFELLDGPGETLFKDHLSQLAWSSPDEDIVPDINWEDLFERIQKEKGSRFDTEEEMVNADNTHTPHRLSYYKWSAAALVLIFMGAGLYLFFKKDSLNVASQNQPPLTLSEITPPDANRAVLTLDNGQQIPVDSLGNTTLAHGNIQIQKGNNGQLIIHGAQAAGAINSLTNPKGSKVLALVLDDGTNVWLNAASTIRFPGSFPSDKREVTLEGEAYFEVIHNAKKPFFVKNGKMLVKVLGTHFNVSAYNDDASIKVTLLQGSVNVKSGNIEKRIKPGQQADIDTNSSSPIHIQTLPDPDLAVAWQNGKFVFKDQDIHAIMRQVARWYNVDVKYQDEIKENFYAEVSRNTSIATLLKMLEATSMVHFKLINKTVIVMKGTG